MNSTVQNSLMKVGLKKGFGWIPDLPDARDWLWRDVRRVPRRLPGRVDLSSGCSSVEDQGALGSCTAQALAGALEFLERRVRGSYTDRSRLFLYYNERVLLGTVKSDSGATLRDGIKTLVKQGVCAETTWPYRVAKFAVRPPARSYVEALDHQLTSYRRLLALNEFRASLAEGFPFVFGFMVYESLQTQKVVRTGDIPFPSRQERAIGGHAVMAVGYDDRRKRFLIRNSWGRRWGQEGYGTLPYAYLDDRNLSDDFWTVRSAESLS